MGPSGLAGSLRGLAGDPSSLAESLRGLARSLSGLAVDLRGLAGKRKYWGPEGDRVSTRVY